MSLDPRFPALPLAVEHDPEHVIVTREGEIRSHNNLIYTEHDVGRIRAGYCCINCGESQVDMALSCPFPVVCWVCGYKMRDRQAERFAMEFVGNVRLGPGTTIDEELAIAEEMLELERREREGIRTPSIIVPRSF